jgi:hypothetical protein
MTIPIIILYIVCFGLVLWQFFAIRQEQREVEAIQRLRDQCVENSRAYLRLEARVSVLERKAR